MSDRITRSVPMDKTTGMPQDESLRMLDTIPEKFDPKKFMDGLPKTETSRFASMSEATAKSPTVKVVENTKPKVTYKGKILDPIVYELDVPFEIDGLDVVTVTVSSPTGAMYDGFQAIVENYGADVAIMWLALGGLNPDIVEAIFATDRAELNEIILPFLPRLLRRNIEAEKAERQAALLKKTEASSPTAEPGLE